MKEFIANFGGSGPISGTGTSGSIVSIDYAHSEVHEGNFYHTSKLFLAIASGNYVALALQTGPSQVHCSLSISSKQNALIFNLIEVPTIAGYVSNPIFNSNRTSINVPNATASTKTGAATLVTGGTIILSGIIPGGGGGNGAGGIGSSTIRTGTEIILAPNELYVLEIQNDSVGNDDISIQAGFYEN